jgi:hypothetical protein
VRSPAGVRGRRRYLHSLRRTGSPRLSVRDRAGELQALHPPRQLSPPAPRRKVRSRDRTRGFVAPTCRRLPAVASHYEMARRLRRILSRSRAADETAGYPEDAASRHPRRKEKVTCGKFKLEGVVPKRLDLAVLLGPHNGLDQGEVRSMAREQSVNGAMNSSQNPTSFAL